jgi:hypothetical protein
MYGREATKQEYSVPRSTKEAYGRYLKFEDPVPWYKREKPLVACMCAVILVIAFGIFKGYIL